MFGREIRDLLWILHENYEDHFGYFLKTSSLNGLYGLQHCSSVTNAWKSQQWVIGDCTHSWQLQNAIFRDKAFTMVTGELCVLFEKKSTKWIPALQVWCVWKAMLFIWVSCFLTLFENTNKCYNCCKYLYLSQDNYAYFLFVFYALFFSRILRKNTGIEET